MNRCRFSKRLKHKVLIKYSKFSPALSRLCSNGEIKAIDFDNARIILQ